MEAPDLVGRTISQYEILAKLGEGGMGVVYKARDTRLNRTVALKFLSPLLLANEEAKQRFLHEAQAAAGLDDPHICTVHEIHEAEGHTFIVMNYVEGRSLQERIRSGPLPIGEALDIARQIGQGLSRAHQQGIVHRDIKPGNVLLTPQGRVKIVDFGLAKLASQTQLTRTGTTMGTVAYMSPEQAKGETVDRRTDIWALAVVLHEMLTGEPPFKGDNQVAVIHSILKANPRPVSRVRKDVSIGLENVLGKALAKNPRKRHDEVDRLVADLETEIEAVALERGPGRLITLRRLFRMRPVRYGALAGVLLAGLAAATTVYQARAAVIDSVAVLPLENLSGDPDKEYFADGMTDELIATLGQVKALNVISRQSVKQYKGSDAPLPEIAHQLHVDAVVEGSLRLDGDRVRITAQLVDARKDRQIWAKTFQGDVKDVLSLQAEMARAITRNIRIALTPEEEASLARVRQVDPAAYDACLKGQHYYANGTEADVRKSIEYFRDAIDIDPTYAMPYAGLAFAYHRMADWGYASPEDAIAKAKAAAAKALELDDSLAEAHVAAYRASPRDYWDGSSGVPPNLTRALELNPNSLDARLARGNYLVKMGRYDEGIADIKRAIEIDPLGTYTSLQLGWANYMARRYDAAIAALKETLDLDPKYAYAWEELAWSYNKAGRAAEALAAADSVLALTPSPIEDVITLSGLIRVYANSGREDKARELLDQLLDLGSRRYVDAYYVAEAYLAFGETDSALTWLETAYREGSPSLVFLKRTPWPELVNEPRYRDLISRLGFSTD